MSFWIGLGNSESVAKKHYLQVTDEHFVRGALDERALHNPVQQSAARTRNDSQGDSVQNQKTLALQGFTSDCDSLRIARVAEEGLEVSLEYAGKTYFLGFAGDQLGINHAE